MTKEIRKECGKWYSAPPGKLCDRKRGHKGDCGKATESRERQVCGYKMAEGICGAQIHKSATSYTGWEHDENASWLHFATDKVTDHPRFLNCAACGKHPDYPAHLSLTGHRFINVEALRQPESTQEDIDNA